MSVFNEFAAERRRCLRAEFALHLLRFVWLCFRPQSRFLARRFRALVHVEALIAETTAAMNAREDKIAAETGKPANIWF